MTKPMLIPYVNQENTAVTIGGFQHNISRDLEVENPDLFLEFLKYLTGENSFEDICLKFELSHEQYENILESLQQNGVIQENEHCFPFSKDEYTYYSRNINFFSWIDIKGLYYNYWEVQDKLSNSNILLLGAGGTGGVNAVNLARLGVGNITIVDYDIVEISNLNRQTFFYKDVGLKKVDALEKHINDINPFINITTIEKKVCTLDDLMGLGTNYDLVLCCIDQPQNIMELLEAYTSITKIPRALGGYASTIINHSIFTENSHSYANMIKTSNSKFDTKKVDENVFWKWDNAVISPIAYMSGSITALSIFYYLTGLNDLKEGLVHHIDLYNLHNTYFSYYIGESGLVEP